VSAPNVYDASKYAFWVVALCVIVLIVLGISGHGHDRTLRLPSGNYGLKIANNTAERAKGLGGRDHLDEGSGMLFVFSETGKRCFWMKDMRFSIDMLWVDGTKKLTHIEHSVAPETYPNPFCADGRYVIELPAGVAAHNHLQAGDTITF
jgi:uncharacterized membrane protein (UPF0127 family)